MFVFWMAVGAALAYYFKDRLVTVEMYVRQALQKKQG